MIDTIIFIFCFVDDFCKLYEDALKKFALLSGKRLRKPTLSYDGRNHYNFAGFSEV